MKKILLVISILIILIGIPTTVFLAQQRQELRQRAAPATTLSFSPSTVSKAVAETFSLDVVIDTGLNQVVVAEVHVSFDETKLEAQTITNSPLFPSILTAGVVDKGAASITVGATDTKTPIKGTGKVATIKFKALAATDIPTSISFAQSTYVTSVVEGSTNVLIGTTPASVAISGVGGTGNNTATPTPTPSPTPKASATPTPTNYPSLTPSPTSTVSAQVKTISISPFQGGTAVASPSTTSAPVPVSGSVSNTYLLIIMGFVMLILGLLYPAIIS